MTHEFMFLAIHNEFIFVVCVKPIIFLTFFFINRIS
jgi:hypothetical protein